jgi:hypothetical protein
LNSPASSPLEEDKKRPKGQKKLRPRDRIKIWRCRL